MVKSYSEELKQGIPQIDYEESIESRYAELRKRKIEWILYWLKQAENLEFVMQKFYSQNVTLAYINDKIKCFELYAIHPEKEVYLKKMNQLCTDYRQFLKNERNKAKNIEKEKEKKLSLSIARNTVMSYIQMRLPLNIFLSKGMVTRKAFNHYLDIVQEYDGEVYQAYEKYETLRKKEEGKNNRQMIEQMADYIENGISLEDQSVREFDALDYHLMTKLSYTKFLSLAKKYLSEEQFKKVYLFIRPLEASLLATSMEQQYWILKGNSEVCCKKK